jgi:hypothetical protein
VTASGFVPIKVCSVRLVHEQNAQRRQACREGVEHLEPTEMLTEIQTQGVGNLSGGQPPP